MPRTAINQELDISTRGMTKVQAQVSLSVDGRELPSMEVLGKALEKGIEKIQEVITDSYKIIPPRTNTDLAEPYKQQPAPAQ